MCGRGLIPEATALMGKYWVLLEQRFSYNLSIMCLGQPLSPETNLRRWMGDDLIRFDRIKGVITQSQSHFPIISSGLYKRILLNWDLWAISSLALSVYALLGNPINATIFVFPHFIPDLLQPLKIFSVSFTFLSKLTVNQSYSTIFQSIRSISPHRDTWKAAGRVIGMQDISRLCPTFKPVHVWLNHRAGSMWETVNWAIEEDASGSRMHN